MTSTILGWPLSNLVYLLTLCLVVMVAGMSGMAAGTWFEVVDICLAPEATDCADAWPPDKAATGRAAG